MENTNHMLSCPNRQTRSDISHKLWEEVREAIREAQPSRAPDPHLLAPFALRTESAPPPPTPAGWEGATFAQLRKVRSFPAEAAQLGLIPSSLKGALRELKVPKPRIDEVAHNVASLVKRAVVEDIRLRARALGEERGLKDLFRAHALPQVEVDGE